MGKVNDIDPSVIDLIEKTVDSVFKTPIRCTREEHEILLLKAYMNILEGGEVLSIDKQVPDEEIDHYKQYDRRCRVIFIDPGGVKRKFYMSYQSSGKEAGRYWKYKYKNLANKVMNLEQG